MKTQLPRPIGCFLLGNKHKTLRKSSGAHSHLQLNLGRLIWFGSGAICSPLAYDDYLLLQSNQQTLTHKFLSIFPINQISPVSLVIRLLRLYWYNSPLFIGLHAYIRVRMHANLLNSCYICIVSAEIRGFRYCIDMSACVNRVLERF